MAQRPPSRSKKLLGGLLTVVILAAAGAASWIYLQKASQDVMSENAVITADVVNVASSVTGRVVKINVAENQRVAKGDLLFAVDAEPYRLAVAQATADLRLAEASRDAQRRTITAEQSNAVVANQQIDRAKTNLALAEATVTRLTPLAQKGYISAQKLDEARSARDDAKTSLDQALGQAEAADALVSTLDASEALVEARRAALAIAERSLDDTQVYAPHDGLVVGLAVSTGQVVAPGQALFTLIDTAHWYASAIFPETELGHISVGSCAQVYVLAKRSEKIRGTVNSIGWGVVSEDLVNIPFGVPYVPKSLDWVRIVQRFPVRIAIDDPPENLMRMGASAVVVVHQGDAC